MGGLAFKDPAILTPRMPPDVYHDVKERVLKLLQPHFRYVSVPIETPGKTSYGDLDVLICDPIQDPSQNEISKPENLSVLLKARLWKRVPGSPTINFALPWPEPTTPDNETNIDPASPNSDDLKVFGTSPPHQPTPKPAGRFIQVDIHACPTLQNFNWVLFNHAHGDMWNLIGSVIRRFGIVVNDKALHILIPELASANANKHLTRVKITDDPKRVLAYLELDYNTFWTPFESEDDMMAYAATCRFHNPERGKKRVRGDDIPDGADKDDDADRLGLRTKANDRRRAAQRPIFQNWLDVYLPEHVGDKAGSASHLSKQEVVEDAKRFFGKAFADRYDAARRRGIMVVQSQRMWADVRETIKKTGAEGAELGYAIKGLKRCVQGDKFDARVQSVVQRAATQAKAQAQAPAQAKPHSSTASPPLKAVDIDMDIEDEDGDHEPEPEGFGPENDNDLIEHIGFEVPGLLDARRDFRELRYELVKEWIMEENKWMVIGRMQRQKDEKEGGERLRVKMEKEIEMEKGGERERGVSREGEGERR